MCYLSDSAQTMKCLWELPLFLRKGAVVHPYKRFSKRTGASFANGSARGESGHDSSSTSSVRVSVLLIISLVSPSQSKRLGFALLAHL